MILVFTLLVAASFLVHPSSLGGEVYPGDGEFAALDYASALEKYDSLYTENSGDPQLLWRMARLYVCMGDVAERATRGGFYRTAERYARECILSDSLVAEGHTWLAASLGNIAMFEGSQRKVELSNEIQYELDWALRLDPEDDVAYSILGSFYRALGGVSWLERRLADLFLGGLPEGGYEESERALMRAIELAPDIMRHHFELGVLYLNWDRCGEARSAFERAALCPVLVARDRSRQSRARKWAHSLGSEQ